MAVSYVHSTTTSAAGTSLTLTAPTGIEDGDILIVGISSDRIYNTSYVTGTPAAPDASWTEIAYQPVDIYAVKVSVFWKRASSESGNYTFTANTDAGATYMIGVIGCYRGCMASGNPVDIFSNTAYKTNNNILRAAGITPSVGNGIFVFVGALHATAAANRSISSNPSGMSSRHITKVAVYSISLADLTYADTSASGDKDATLSGAAVRKHAFLVALKPPETTAIKSVNGLAKASVKSFNGLAIASVKSINGLE